MARVGTWEGETGDIPLASSIRNAGCGRFSTKLTVSSRSAVTSSRLRYHALRGLRRSALADLPSSMSHVHLTSCAVKGFPSCHLTPWRSRKLSRVWSSFHDQLSASSNSIKSVHEVWYN